MMVKRIGLDRVVVAWSLLLLGLLSVATAENTHKLGSRSNRNNDSKTMLQEEYKMYCGSQDKEQMETATSVTDANTRPMNKCMCGFLQSPHDTTPMVQAATTRTGGTLGSASLGATVIACKNGYAGPYPCKNVDLVSYRNVLQVNSASDPYGTMNDIWGWTDSQTGREYALIGTKSGTSFIDITDPLRPINIGNLPTRTVSSMWRDIKTYNDHAFIVAESRDHGMQVFDLTQLRGLHGSRNIPVAFQETAHYNGFTNSHNIAINEDTGYAYAVGTNTCNGGLHMIDIQNPRSPKFAGCFADDGYSHDVQCVTYRGSDAKYVGREICFGSNANHVAIVDVSDKSNPTLISRLSYADSDQTYTHQGWLTPDHKYFLLGDETDERIFLIRTTTHVLNVMDLDNPFLAGSHTASTYAIDHNQYIHGNLVYQANYRAGLRILEMTDLSRGRLNEVGFFDIYPQDPQNDRNFNGAWSVYPFFDSGNVIVSGVEQGLFVLRPTGAAANARQLPPTNAPTTYSERVCPTIPMDFVCVTVNGCSWDYGANACFADGS